MNEGGFPETFRVKDLLGGDLLHLLHFVLVGFQLFHGRRKVEL